MNLSRRNFLLGTIGCSLTPALVKSSVVTGLAPLPSAPSTSSSLDLSRLLRAIAWVESGNRDNLIGPCGERSRYQITRGVFHQYSKLPHEHCHGPYADWIAWQHLVWLYNLLHNKQTREEVFTLAWAWRAGPTPILHNLFSWRNDIFNDYATRVFNLYHDPRT